MAQRKPYNPNTSYGRRKLREQAQQHYNELPPEKQDEWDMWKLFILLGIVAVVLLIALATGNEKGAAKWLTR